MSTAPTPRTARSNGHAGNGRKNGQKAKKLPPIPEECGELEIEFVRAYYDGWGRQYIAELEERWDADTDGWGQETVMRMAESLTGIVELYNSACMRIRDVADAHAAAAEAKRPAVSRILSEDPTASADDDPYRPNTFNDVMEARLREAMKGPKARWLLDCIDLAYAAYLMTRQPS